MCAAEQLVAEIKKELSQVGAQIERHRYLEALERGAVPREALCCFAAQQSYIISSDLRSISVLLSRHGQYASREFLLKVLQGESAALAALEQFSSAVGLRCEDLSVIEPLAGAVAYCHYMAWLGLYGSDAEFAAAVLVNFPAWGGNCARMSRALQERYGLDQQAVAFFDLFANLPPLDEEAMPVIDAGLARGVDPKLIRRASRMVQAYELMYWDALAEAAGV